LLDGEKLKSFLDFNESLKNKQLSKGATTKGNSGYIGYAIRYKGYMICHFRAYQDYWFISYFKSVDINKCKGFVSDELKEFILENIVTIPPCQGCQGRDNKIIFDKHFDKVCGCHLLRLNNPDGKALEYAKKLILINKNIVDDILANKT
jgi:hypothetical protein